MTPKNEALKRLSQLNFFKEDIYNPHLQLHPDEQMKNSQRIDKHSWNVSKKVYTNDAHNNLEATGKAFKSDNKGYSNNIWNNKTSLPILKKKRVCKLNSNNLTLSNKMNPKSGKPKNKKRRIRKKKEKEKSLKILMKQIFIREKPQPNLKLNPKDLRFDAEILKNLFESFLNDNLKSPFKETNAKEIISTDRIEMLIRQGDLRKLKQEYLNGRIREDNSIFLFMGLFMKYLGLITKMGEEVKVNQVKKVMKRLTGHFFEKVNEIKIKKKQKRTQSKNQGENIFSNKQIFLEIISKQSDTRNLVTSFIKNYKSRHSNKDLMIKKLSQIYIVKSNLDKTKNFVNFSMSLKSISSNSNEVISAIVKCMLKTNDIFRPISFQEISDAFEYVEGIVKELAEESIINR